MDDTYRRPLVDSPQVHRRLVANVARLLSLIIHAKLKALMSHGDGIRVGFDWRGQSGLQPCVKHFNVRKIGLCNFSSLAQEPIRPSDFDIPLH